MTNTPTITKTIKPLIDRRVRKGFDVVTSVVVLNQLLVSHDGDNLVHALCYNGFATEKQATEFVKGIK